MTSTLRDLVDGVVEDVEMFGPDGPCPVSFEPGANERVLLVTGGNASGKSLVCRFLALGAREDKVEFMRIGMGLRTQSGIHRAFMFGEEDADSTGRISGKTLRGAVSTSRNRDKPHFVCLDEPDIGLSEEMQDAMGQKLAAFGADLPPLAYGLAVVTHSRGIASRLMALDPMRIRVGRDAVPTARWISEGPPPVTEADFDDMERRGLETFRAVAGIMEARKAERRAPGPGR